MRLLLSSDLAEMYFYFWKKTCWLHQQSSEIRLCLCVWKRLNAMLVLGIRRIIPYSVNCARETVECAVSIDLWATHWFRVGFFFLLKKCISFFLLLCYVCQEDNMDRRKCRSTRWPVVLTLILTTIRELVDDFSSFGSTGPKNGKRSFHSIWLWKWESPGRTGAKVIRGRHHYPIFFFFFPTCCVGIWKHTWESVAWLG